jgi:hypothetical protein
VLVIGVSVVMTGCRLPPISLSNSYDEWNWFECRICSASQTLIEVAAQIISGFISFGALHIHTAGFQPWQWLDQD